MRINAKIMAAQIKQNLAKQSDRLARTQLQLATGKRINKPSDDPVGIGKVLDYRTTQRTIGQYRENILDARTRLEFTEPVLGQVGELIESAKKIAINPNADDKTGLAREIANIRQQVLGLANSKYGADYLFAGHRSHTAPFDPTSPYTYNGDGGAHPVMVGEGITIKIEADGSQMFVDGTDNLFGVFDDLEAALSAAPYDPAAIQNVVDPLYRIAKRVQQARIDLASDYQRLERTDAHWHRFGNAVESMRQSVEDADMTQAAVDMQIQQTAYEVLLATAGRIVQPSLIDFLR